MVEQTTSPMLEGPAAALWSIQFFTSAGLDARDLDQRLQPMPLSWAIKVVATARDEHATYRQRRALSKLTEAGLHRASRPAIDALVDVLGVNPGLLAIEDPVAAMDFLNRELSAAANGPGVIVVRDCVPRHYPRTLISTATAIIEINRPLHDLCTVLDPRSWKDCSHFFAASYRCARDDYLPSADQLPRGQQWEGYLFERFCVPQASFENVLRVRFRPGAQEIRVDYELHDSPAFTFAGLRRQGVLEVDDGYVVARHARPGWTEIEMQKTVEFADLTPNSIDVDIDPGRFLSYFASPLLCAWIDDPNTTLTCLDHHPPGGNGSALPGDTKE